MRRLLEEKEEAGKRKEERNCMSYRYIKDDLAKEE